MPVLRRGLRPCVFPFNLLQPPAREAETERAQARSFKACVTSALPSHAGQRRFPLERSRFLPEATERLLVLKMFLASLCP